MHDTIIAELETAARIVMQPPSNITNEQRTMAESVIMKFRHTAKPYALCREIFEKSACDLLLFETADTLKRAIIGEWYSLQPDDKLLLRQYLLTYCIERDVPSFIRAKVLQVVSIMIKRASIDDTGIERLQIMHEMDQMLQLGNQQQQYLACRIVNTLMQEFLHTIKSDDTGLTFEEHFKAKKMFELSDLKRIYVMVFRAAEKMMAAGFDVGNAEQLALMGEYLAIFEIIMLWGYISPLLPKRLISALESSGKMDHSPSLRLGAQWTAVILEPQVLELFFGIYWKVCDVPVLQHRAMTCLVQMATLNGAVLDTVENRVKYVTNYLTHFLNVLAVRTPTPDEAYSVAMVFRKILLHTTEGNWLRVPEELRNTILQHMFGITCAFMDAAVQEEKEDGDNARYRPALDHILEAWLLILQMRRSFVQETIQQYSVQMFNKYLQSRLSWAALNGAGVATDPNESTASAHNRSHNSSTATAGAGDDDELDDGRTENDRYEEQLVIVGMLGRENLACSLPTLCGLLEERTATLREQLLRIYTAQSVQPTDAAIMAPIYDDIQWLTMIAAHVLAIHASAGEETAIPTEVRVFSVQRQRDGLTDLTATLQLLAAPSQQVRDIENAETGADLVVRLVAAVFRLCDLENTAIELKMVSLLSPEVARSVMWFVLMWSNSYLLETYGNETTHQQQHQATASARRASGIVRSVAAAAAAANATAAATASANESLAAAAADAVAVSEEDRHSVALRQAFGTGTDGGKWTIDFLLNKICINVRSFPAEPLVVDTSLNVFVQAAGRSAKAPVVFQSELFKQIVDLRHLDVQKTTLLRGLMLVGVCVTPEELRNQYLFEILSPIEKSFQKLEWQSAMSTSSPHGKSTVALQLTRLLDEICACCAGATPQINKSIYAMFETILHNIADVVDLFHNYEAVVLSVLQLLCTIVDRLRGSETKLNDICIRVVRAYVRHNANRVTVLGPNGGGGGGAGGGSASGGGDDSDTLDDLELLLKLARCFLNAAMFDLLADSDNDGGEVCSTILKYILPMVTLERLKYPQFCLNFYQTLQLYVDKSLMQMQSDFLESIVGCVQMGLTTFGAEIQQVCLELLTTMASNTYFEHNPQTYLYGALRTCLQHLFRMILTHDIDSDNRAECGRAVFTLLCVYRAQYDQVQAMVLQEYADKAKVEQLRVELEQLVDREALYNNRGSHLQFAKRFEKFLANLTTLC